MLICGGFHYENIDTGQIYDSPGTPINVFDECFKNTIILIKCFNVPCYLLSDFNKNYLNK